MPNLKHRIKHMWHKLRGNPLILGILMALWFVIRVGEKPSRAAYPCQRAAISHFEGYIPFSYLPFTYHNPAAYFRNIFSHIRRFSSARNLALLLLLSISIASPILTSNFKFEKQHEQFKITKAARDAAVASAAAIALMGSLKENYPHRVVSVHDSDATSWDFSCTTSCGSLYYGDNAYTNQVAVDRMFDRGLMELSGKTTVFDAWKEIIPNYQAGEKVAIKVNFNNAGNWVETDAVIDALPQPIISIVRGLKLLGLQEGDIIVYDATRPIPDRFRNVINAKYPNLGYYGRLSNGGQVKAVTKTSTDPSAWVDFSASGFASAEKIPDQLISAAYLIDLPIMKKHEGTGITLSFKNHFGTFFDTAMHSYMYLTWPDYSPTKNPFV
ncbi:MAG: DUF362 domain-containing protein, partial [Candidatus Micrarchaeota archaeon]